MKLVIPAWPDGGRIPERHAAGRRDPAHGVAFSDDVSPALAWSELPAGVKSLALICHDPDVPSRGDDVNQPDREVPADLPRVDFFHWVLVDLPPTLDGLAEGDGGPGFVPRGKPGPQGPHGGRRRPRPDRRGWAEGRRAPSGRSPPGAGRPAPRGRAG